MICLLLSRFELSDELLEKLFIVCFSVSIVLRLEFQLPGLSDELFSVKIFIWISEISLT